MVEVAADAGVSAAGPLAARSPDVEQSSQPRRDAVGAGRAGWVGSGQQGGAAVRAGSVGSCRAGWMTVRVVVRVTRFRRPGWREAGEGEQGLAHAGRVGPGTQHGLVDRDGDAGRVDPHRAQPRRGVQQRLQLLGVQRHLSGDGRQLVGRAERSADRDEDLHVGAARHRRALRDSRNRPSRPGRRPGRAAGRRPRPGGACPRTARPRSRRERSAHGCAAAPPDRAAAGRRAGTGRPGRRRGCGSRPRRRLRRDAGAGPRRSGRPPPPSG